MLANEKSAWKLTIAFQNQFPEGHHSIIEIYSKFDLSKLFDFFHWLHSHLLWKNCFQHKTNCYIVFFFFLREGRGDVDGHFGRWLLCKLLKWSNTRMCTSNFSVNLISFIFSDHYTCVEHKMEMERWLPMSLPQDYSFLPCQLRNDVPHQNYVFCSILSFCVIIFVGVQCTGLQCVSAQWTYLLFWEGVFTCTSFKF